MGSTAERPCLVTRPTCRQLPVLNAKRTAIFFSTFFFYPYFCNINSKTEMLRYLKAKTIKNLGAEEVRQ